jgi:hypothetical protein
LLVHSENTAQRRAILDTLQTIAKEKGANAAQVAIAWISAHDIIICLKESEFHQGQWVAIFSVLHPIKEFNGELLFSPRCMAGGWVWKRVARRLREQGHDVYTPTMTGVGERGHLLNATINLSTNIQDIVRPPRLRRN